VHRPIYGRYEPEIHPFLSTQLLGTFDILLQLMLVLVLVLVVVVLLHYFQCMPPLCGAHCHPHRRLWLGELRVLQHPVAQPNPTHLFPHQTLDMSFSISTQFTVPTGKKVAAQEA
jgi:hypothetical protein